MNEGLTGLERHEGEELMTEFSFLESESESALLPGNVMFANIFGGVTEAPQLWMIPLKEVNILFPLLVLGLRDFLRGSSQLLIFADEAFRLLPHGFLRVLQPPLQVCDPPVQRRQVCVRLSDLHRRRGRHARHAEDESTGPLSSLSPTTTPHRWTDHLPRSGLNDAELSLNLRMRDSTSSDARLSSSGNLRVYNAATVVSVHLHAARRFMILSYINRLLQFVLFSSQLTCHMHQLHSNL